MPVQQYSASASFDAPSYSPLQFLHSFLQAPREDAGPYPPRKKQRISTSKSSAGPPPKQLAAPSEEDTVLERVVVDVALADKQADSIPSAQLTDLHDSEFRAAQVDVRRETEDRDDFSATIRLTEKSHAETLRLKSQYAKEIYSSVSRISRFSRKPPSSDRHDPAWCSLKVSFPDQELRSMRLEATLLWRKNIAASLTGNSKQTFPYPLPVAHDGEADRRGFKWEISDFYNAVHVPLSTLQVAPEIQHPGLDCDLYPFQQRAVDWLLYREGVRFNQGRLKSLPESEKHPPPSCFQPFEDALGHQRHFSRLHGMVVDTPPQYQSLPGGILCEEMGLGKTIELLALVSLHKRKAPVPGINQWGFYESSATLVITPPHLMPQWRSEIARHAPSLRVLNYTGLQSLGKKNSADQDVQDLLEYDVVLTTYTVLGREIHYAEEPPERNFRHKKQYEARRSPLVQISWWRICLDEAQMIESGVTKAAIVARLIPRVNAWAVTGTPLKKNLEDLFGLLLFLGYQPFCDSRKLWSRVDKGLFTEIVNQIALRHTKDTIRQELRLPPQKRVVITVPFTAIEHQNYSQLVQQMCEDCGLRPDGAPGIDGIDFESPVLIGKMREWLQRLRQTCCHPQVGGRNRRRLGRGNRPLKTVDEVLEIMIDQNETGLRAEQRQVVLLKVRYGLIISNNSSDQKRWSTALDIYKNALDQATEFVGLIRAELAAEKEKDSMAENSKKADVRDEDADRDGEEDEKSEASNRLAALQKTLRSAIEVQHVCAFFVGTAYFQLKEEQGRRDEAAQKGEKSQEKAEPRRSKEYNRLEALEEQFYDQAKAMRKEMLRECNEAAQRLMRRVADLGHRRHIAAIPPLEDLGGIESRKYLDKLDELSELLDRQAKLLDKVRGKAAEYLLLPLIDEDDGKDLTGEEYDESTKKQDELPVYITVLRALVADRHRMLTGQEINRLVEDETKQAARIAEKGHTHAPEDKGHAPELCLHLLAQRDKLVLHEDAGSLRAVVSGIRATCTALQWQSAGGSARAGTEAAIAERQLKKAQQISSAQVKLVEELEKELDLFTKTMNQRLEFYRQLQVISDTVAPFKDEEDQTLDMAAIQEQQAAQKKSEERLATLSTKRRFLLHLRGEATSEEARMCVICQGSFEIGVLTVCGHQYCKECIGHWWRQHRTCPVCKRLLHLVDFHDITYVPQELRAEEEEEEEQHTAAPASRSEASSSPGASATIYSDMNANTLKEIKSVDLRGSYGTKIDTIARHLLWIREHDPGAKSILYSQYSDFLHVLGGALKHFKIGFVSFSGRSGVERFKQDPSIECFLLDAKSDSSGLNLVNATYVMLCEPLINTAVELQAIARVHRIGQQRATTVFMYLIGDTVEESIYDISASRRLEHMRGRSAAQPHLDSAPSRAGTQTPQAQQEIALDQANSMELQATPISALLTKGRGGGEVVDKGDLWNCLFAGGKSAPREMAASGEMARVVGRFLRADAADARRGAEMLMMDAASD